MKNFSDSFKVVWFLNNICNFSCEYCLDRLGRDDPHGINKLINPDLVRYACRNFLSLGHDKYNFTLFGGETTLYPDLPGLLDVIYHETDNKLNDLMFTTNASRGIDYFKQFIGKFDNRFIIRTSVHFEHYNEELFKIIEMLSENNIRVYVEIMYHPRFVNLVSDTVMKLYVMKQDYPLLNGRVKPVFGTIPFDTDHYFFDYSEDNFNLLETFNRTLGYTSYKYKKDQRELGKYCIVGSNKILIEPDGNVLNACPCSNTQEKVNIFHSTPKKLKEKYFHIVRCTSDKPCLHSPKTKFETYLEAKEELGKLLQ